MAATDFMIFIFGYFNITNRTKFICIFCVWLFPEFCMLYYIGMEKASCACSNILMKFVEFPFFIILNPLHEWTTHCCTICWGVAIRPPFPLLSKTLSPQRTGVEWARGRWVGVKMQSEARGMLHRAILAFSHIAMNIHYVLCNHSVAIL